MATLITENQPLFDPAEALSRACDDHDMLAELIEMFAAAAEEMLAAVEVAIGQGEAEEIKITAHSLKGAISTLSTGPAYLLAKSIEHSALAGDVATAAELFPQFQQTVREFVIAVVSHQQTATR
jgi:HPt (histidine-containing phosphotransfer) domain-containing protein